MHSDPSLFNQVLIWSFNGLYFLIPIFALLGFVQLAFAFLFWSSEKRKSRLRLGGVFLGMALLTPLVLYGFGKWVVWPSITAELTERALENKEAEYAQRSHLRVGAEVAQLDRFFEDVGFPLNQPKLVVLNFFATWCGPCFVELPHLQEMADKYVDREEIRFVVVGRDESQETLDAFVAENGYRIPFVADPDSTLYSEFAKAIIPRTYLIDHDRKIRFEVIGFDQEKLKELDMQISEIIKKELSDDE